MDNESKNPTAKEAVIDQIASALRHAERRITDMAEKMNADFRNFFEWRAEEMYKTQKRRAFYTELLKKIENNGDNVNLTEGILAIANHKSNELVRGSLTRNSTNQMANLAHLLNLEAEQELIRELEGLAHVANYYAQL